MEALSLDDLLPLEEYASKRREYFASHVRYLDRYRRVRVGPRLTLVFENRQTLWFRLHEVLRVARLSDPTRVRQELELYNRLLPSTGRLQAALIIDIEDETRLEEELRPWRELRGDSLALEVGPVRCPANLLTCRPEDRAIGAAHWVQFVVDGGLSERLGDLRQAVCIRVQVPGYSHDSGPLGDDVRLSLVQDLKRAG